MATPDPLLWAELGLAFFGVGIALYVLGDQKTEKMSEDMDELYWKLREKRLDPIIEEIIEKRQPKDDPHKVMSLPEVTERFRTHNRLVEEYMDADEYRFVINSTLEYSYFCAFVIGTIEVGFAIAEAYISGASDYWISNIVALALGAFFLGLFLWKYRSYANGYIEAVRKVRRSCA